MIGTEPAELEQGEAVFSGDGGRPSRHAAADFELEFLNDPFNRRLTVIRHDGDVEAICAFLDEQAKAARATKIFFRTGEASWDAVLSHGYVLEGIIRGYYRGANAYCLARFFTRRRRFGQHFEEEKEILDRVRQIPPFQRRLEAPPEIVTRTAGPDDAAELAALYRSVFETYPTPLNDPAYIREEMSGDCVYRVACHAGRIVSAAAAAVDWPNGAAELTDCATAPAYRGRGIIQFLLQELEADVVARGVRCTYGMARALSQGMNLAFRRLGYAYQGRLINHCHIMGRFEDVNLWVKAEPPTVSDR
ncbi:MAG TPA: putative beta-lysine N-acetyltransferase [Limnochordia bacterium]